MTIINRFCPELSDIKAVRIECAECGTALSYDVSKDWKARGVDCPNCRATLVGEGPSLRALQGLAEAIKLSLLVDNARSFRVRLEFDHES